MFPKEVFRSNGVEAVLEGPEVLKSKDGWWVGRGCPRLLAGLLLSTVSALDQQRSAFRSTWIRVPALGSALAGRGDLEQLFNLTEPVSLPGK